MKILPIVKDKKFTPEWNGNRELPEGEQIVVNVKTFPTPLESQSYVTYTFSNDGSSMAVKYEADAVMLRRHIGSIKGIDLPSGFDPITNGSSLASTKCGEFSGLISEIREYLRDTADLIPEGED